MATIIYFPLHRRMEDKPSNVVHVDNLVELKPFQPIIEVLEKSNWPPKDMLAPEEPD